MSKKMKKGNLPLSIAIFGLDVCSKDEKMYETLAKVPNLIRTCILIAMEHFKETGLLDEAHRAIEEIADGIDFSGHDSNREKVGAFLGKLSEIMMAEAKKEQGGD